MDEWLPVADHHLAKVRILYAEIAKQLSGLLWKDGGPVIGIQFENEYWGPAQHLLTLEQIAREVGLDVPLYTRTGWPGLSSPMPFGEIVPLYGVYAEGFWDREITPMPGQYWSGFHFSPLRADANIANELFGQRDARDDADVARYPYLTCEIGGGMMNSYHRRILVNPTDIDSTTLVKLGSGSTLPGYCMYHGGVNPDGKLTTLQESQATEYWNDLPVKNCDFQTALGQYGQIRPQYHSLRRLHLFLHGWGQALAGIPAEFAFPAGAGLTARSGKEVRRDGHTLVRGVKPATSVALQATGSGGREVRIVLLDEADSLALWKFTWQGRERVFLSRAGLVVDRAQLRLTSEDREQLSVGVFPGPKSVTSGGRDLRGKADGVFTRFAPPLPKAPSPKVSFEQVQAAGPPRDIPLGKIKQPVPAAPEDADFAKAAVWHLKLPTDLALACDPLLRLDYIGDVTRVTLNGKLLTDDFYNGKPFEIGLRRHAPEILSVDLQVAILPLRKDAPIYLAKEAWPDFGRAESVAALKAADIVPRYQVQLTAQ